MAVAVVQVRAGISLQLEYIAHFRQLGRQLELLVDLLCQGAARFVFAMGQDYARFAGGDRAEPREEVCLARVSTETAQSMNLGFHRDFLAEDADEFIAFHQPSAQRAECLESDNHHMRLGFPQALPEMMQDSPGVAHAGAGHHEARPLAVVDRLDDLVSLRDGRLGEVHGGLGLGRSLAPGAIQQKLRIFRRGRQRPRPPGFPS